MLLNGLALVFRLFSSNPLVQLVLLSPLLLVSLGLILLGLWRIRRLFKGGRRLVGHLLLANLLGYAAFILLELLLAPTGTSYGQPQPVIVVFGALYLLTSGLSLVLFSVIYKIRALQARRGWVVGSYYGLHLAAFAILLYAFYVEPLWLDVTQTTVAESKLPPGTAPIKIVLISDIHMEHWTRRETAALADIQALDPDLIVISGDHINIDSYSDQSYSDLHRFMAGLHARYGVYASQGGVDWPEKTETAVAGTDVHILDDASTEVNVRGQTLQLTGLSMVAHRQDAQKLNQLNEGLSNGKLKLLIYHTPDLAPEAAGAGFDLYLAGHTHGGQIALPFYGAVFTASRYGRRYAAGLYDLGGPAQSKIYVTRGLGMEGMNTPRARLFARPEISVITLVPAS